MRADNRGEGGILALTALALRAADGGRKLHWWILAAGLLGASLFYGDGVITPAISVLSAVEGLKVATPLFDPFVIPLTVALLLALFLFQRRGTALVGGLFGPVMVVWFLVIGVLGLIEIVKQPEILQALNPYYGIALLTARSGQGLRPARRGGAGRDRRRGALRRYGPFRPAADPHRLAELRLSGAAAQLFRPGRAAAASNPGALDNPFYRLAPDWALYPLVALAAAATIIASQAVISGAFSMTRQAVLLGYLPRFEIRHTSEARDRPDLRAQDQSLPAGRGAGAGAGLQELGQSRRGLWHRRHRHDVAHHGARAHLHGRRRRLEQGWRRACSSASSSPSISRSSAPIS